MAVLSLCGEMAACVGQCARGRRSLRVHLLMSSLM
nr:MAG TPA: hypothetical protein [Caudoviricetes sp.]